MTTRRTFLAMLGSTALVPFVPFASVVKWAPIIVVPPVISGAVAVGESLQISEGLWTYQWFCDGRPVDGATVSSLTATHSTGIHGIIGCETTATRADASPR